MKTYDVKNVVTGDPLLQTWLLPDLNTIPRLTTVLERILFSSVVTLLAFRPGVPGSNPVHILYFSHEFIHLFLCYRLCKMGARSGLVKEH